MTYDRDGEIPCPKCKGIADASYVRKWGHCQWCRIQELEVIVEKKDSLVKFLIKRFTEITKPTREDELQEAFAADDYETVMEIAAEAAKEEVGT